MSGARALCEADEHSAVSLDDSSSSTAPASSTTPITSTRQDKDKVGWQRRCRWRRPGRQGRGRARAPR
eukprot:194191-Rhodomonas_salina.2